MSLDGYIVGKIDNPFVWKEGEHTAEVVFVGEKEGKYGNYVSVEWFDEDDKHNLFETFNIWADDEKTQKWQQSEWHKFLLEVAQLKEGEPYSESKVFGKKCRLVVKTYRNKNTGAEKSIVSSRVLIASSKPSAPLQDDLNDEVPFM